MSELIDPAILYYKGHEGWCCDCCAGYCPMEDSPEPYGAWEFMRPIGDDHVGTGRIVLRRDILAPFPEAATFSKTSVPLSTAWATVPDEKPPLSDRGQSPDLLDRIDRAGLTLHHGEEVTHIYLGDRHVGWCKWSPKGVTRDELPLIRKVAESAGISIEQAATAIREVAS